MTDYNWFSDTSIEVAVDGIRAEAKKWFELSDRMSGVASQTANQRLEMSAFAVTDLTGPVTAADLKSAYDKMQHWLDNLFRQAGTEFEHFGEALKKVADWYERADENSAESFDEVAASLPNQPLHRR
jgi:hypothetical protein